MTLNLKPGDHARDADGNVYGPLESTAFGYVYFAGFSWTFCGSPMSQDTPRLVAKVRRVETWQDVPPEPVRGKIVGRVWFEWGEFPENDGLYEGVAIVETIDGRPDMSTLRINDREAALAELARLGQKWDGEPVKRDDLLKMGGGVRS